MTLNDLACVGVIRSINPLQTSSSISIRPLGGAAVGSYLRRSTPCSVNRRRFRCLANREPPGEPWGSRKLPFPRELFRTPLAQFSSRDNSLAVEWLTNRYFSAPVTVILPRSGSRVRIPSPAPEFFGKATVQRQAAARRLCCFTSIY